MAFSSGAVLTAANLNDISINTATLIKEAASAGAADTVITIKNTDADNSLNLTKDNGINIDFYVPSDASGQGGSELGARIAALKDSDTDDNNSGRLIFSTAADGSTPSARLSIDSSGRMGLVEGDVNTSRGFNCVRAGTVFEFHQNTDVASGAVYCGILKIGTNGTAPGTGDYWVLIRKGDDTTIGSIRGTGGNSVNFQTTSDQTMKNDLGDAGDCGAILDKIKIHKYTWKDAPAQGEQIGLFAQEALSEATDLPAGIITPSTTMKEENEAGQEVDSYLPAGVDYSKLVPLVIQEVKSLRQRIATLEG